jgi:hypothetical protein
MVGLEGPEYLAWLGQQPERDYTILMEANIHRAGRTVNLGPATLSSPISVRTWS